MLGKLLKYEFKATSRVFVPMYLALIVLSFIEKILIATGFYDTPNHISNVISATVLILMGIVFAVICVLTIVMIVQRFYKNLLSNEGYLMFTLPVNTTQHITSKLVVMTVWSIASVIVSGLAVVVMFFDAGGFSDLFAQISKAISIASPDVISSAVLMVFEVIIAVITSIVAVILLIYMCLSIGQLVNKHRLLLSFVAFIGVNIVLGNITAKLFPVIDVPKFVDMVSGFNYLFVIYLIFTVIESLVFFFVTRFILDKKLNLE